MKEGGGGEGVGIYSYFNISKEFHHSPDRTFIPEIIKTEFRVFVVVLAQHQLLQQV